jgi:hypothetical protein
VEGREHNVIYGGGLVFPWQLLIAEKFQIILIVINPPLIKKGGQEY